MSGTIGIVGLGRVGIPAARAYIGAGYQVYGYARRSEVIKEFQALGGQHQPESSESCQACRYRAGSGPE